MKKVQEIVVPKTYRSKSGALNKSRALQFCLEEDINILKDEDWIVHLDEETLLTQNSVKGTSYIDQIILVKNYFFLQAS